MKHLPTLLGTVVLAALAAPAAHAQIVNGDFSNGLAGWDTAGDASVSAANTVDPTRLWLTTASVEFADDIGSGLAAGARNVSGNAAVAVGTGAPGALEGFTGVAPGAFDTPSQGLFAYEGSAAKQSFNAAAGTQLSFRWDLGTLDTSANPAFADSAFVVIDGQVKTLASLQSATLPGTDGNALHTGWTNFGYTFASAGVHTISFGVVDIGDFDATSTLAIAGVSVSAVPEASSLAMALAGLGLFGLMGRRRRRG